MNKYSKIAMAVVAGSVMVGVSACSADVRDESATSPTTSASSTPSASPSPVEEVVEEDVQLTSKETCEFLTGNGDEAYALRTADYAVHLMQSEGIAQEDYETAKELVAEVEEFETIAHPDYLVYTEALKEAPKELITAVKNDDGSFDIPAREMMQASIDVGIECLNDDALETYAEGISDRLELIPSEYRIDVPGEEVDEEPVVEEKVEEEPEAAEPEVPWEYENALSSAESYLSWTNFSYNGLYNQLTSEYGEGFPAEAAQYAMDNINVDWNEQALESAKSYLSWSDMSLQGVYDQLVSEYGEDFTPEQAQYAIDNL